MASKRKNSEIDSLDSNSSASNRGSKKQQTLYLRSLLQSQNNGQNIIPEEKYFTVVDILNSKGEEESQTVEVLINDMYDDEPTVISDDEIPIEKNDPEIIDLDSKASEDAECFIVESNLKSVKENNSGVDSSTPECINLDLIEENTLNTTSNICRNVSITLTDLLRGEPKGTNTETPEKVRNRNASERNIVNSISSKILTSANDLEAATSSADLKTSTSAVDLETATSTVDLEAATLAVNLETATSEIDLKTSTSAVDLETSTSAVDLETSISTVNLKAATLEVNLKTATSEIDLKTSTSAVDLETETSAVDLETATLEKSTTMEKKEGEIDDDINKNEHHTMDQPIEKPQNSSENNMDETEEFYENDSQNEIISNIDETESSIKLNTEETMQNESPTVENSEQNEIISDMIKFLSSEREKNVETESVSMDTKKESLMEKDNNGQIEEISNGNENEVSEVRENIDDCSKENEEFNIKYIDASVDTSELEEELKKEGIHEWTHLYQENDIIPNPLSEDKENNKGIQTIPVARQWQHILNSLEQPDDLISYDDRILIIKERQPKSKFHYIVIPIENMKSVSDLKPAHYNLIDDMEKAAKKLISSPEHCKEIFSFGFIGKQSMIMLKNQKFFWFHMHVMSKTPNFAYISIKKHWNLFHSDLFIHCHAVKHMLTTLGRVVVPTPEECNFHLIGPVKCNYCDFESNALPSLTNHIKQEHLKKKPNKKPNIIAKKKSKNI